eukprot:6712162-Pyramimonas_sp.AAC.1
MDALGLSTAELRDMFNNPTLSDVVFRCDDGVSIFAHKFWLSVISKYFRALIENAQSNCGHDYDTGEREALTAKRESDAHAQSQLTIHIRCTSSSALLNVF